MNNNTPQLNNEIRFYSFMRSIEAMAISQSNEELIDIYKKNLGNYKNLKSLCLYRPKNKRWVSFYQLNTTRNYANEDLPEKYHFQSTKHGFTTCKQFEEFDTISPITYKKKIECYILIGWQKDKDSLWIEEINYIRSLTNMFIIMNENRQIQELQRKREEYNYQMHLAKSIQDKLFHADLPYTEKLKIFSSYIPHHAIGGDFYLYKQLSKDKLFFAIGDVSYKGFSAGLIVSNLHAAIEIILQKTNNLTEIVRTINNLINSYDDTLYYASACFFIYDIKYRRLESINSGHPYPFLIDLKTGAVERISKGTSIIGFSDMLEQVEVAVYENLDPFLLFCFTDGLTEYSSDLDNFFEEEQLEAWLCKHLDLDQKLLHSKILDHLKKLNQGSDSYNDDILLFSCQVSH